MKDNHWIALCMLVGWCVLCTVGMVSCHKSGPCELEQSPNHVEQIEIFYLDSTGLEMSLKTLKKDEKDAFMKDFLQIEHHHPVGDLPYNGKITGTAIRFCYDDGTYETVALFGQYVSSRDRFYYHRSFSYDDYVGLLAKHGVTYVAPE